MQISNRIRAKYFQCLPIKYSAGQEEDATANICEEEEEMIIEGLDEFGRTLQPVKLIIQSSGKIIPTPCSVKRSFFFTLSQILYLLSKVFKSHKL